MKLGAGIVVAWTLSFGAAWADECAHDRQSLLALDYEQFDQDPSGGWRPLAGIQDCQAAAADLIAAYRAAHADELAESSQRQLRWHEAQLRAASDDIDAALALFESTRRSDPSIHIRADNLYLDATLAFLRRDRAGLERAREELSALPEPDGFREAIARARERYGDTFADSIRWPSNLDVIDGFLNCFDRPYMEAYGGECRARRVTEP